MSPASAAACAECREPATHAGRCERHRTARASRLPYFYEIGVPPALRAAAFATASATPAIRHARAFADAGGADRGRLLGLLGPTGVGKSWAAACVVDAELAGAPDPGAAAAVLRWVYCATLLRELDDYRLRGDAVARACAGRLLVLDDLQAAPPDVAARFEEILIRREQDGRAVVFTSNLTAKALAAALSDRVLDRIRAWGDLREVRGQSLRRPPSGARDGER